MNPSDTTPPTIAPVITGTTGANGWYTSNVSVSWTVADPESPVSAKSGCDPTTVSADTTAAGVTFTCSATSAGGTGTQAVTITRDATKPTVTYGAHPASYTLDQTVAIPCTATDPTPGSGIASTTCKDVTGPASSFAIGANAFSATATDNAGNVGTGTTSFTVTVTPGAPAKVTATAGGGQSTGRGQPVPQRLIVKVTDQYGNVVPGASVRFATRTIEPTAFFQGVPPQSRTVATVQTDANGIATSPALGAGSTSGQFVATATAVDGSGTPIAGATVAQFPLAIR